MNGEWRFDDDAKETYQTEQCEVVKAELATNGPEVIAQPAFPPSAWSSRLPDTRCVGVFAKLSVADSPLASTSAVRCPPPSIS